MNDGEKLGLGIGNYYGCVELVKEGEKYFLILEDCSEPFAEKEVSPEFAEACIKEFGAPKQNP